MDSNNLGDLIAATTDHTSTKVNVVSERDLVLSEKSTKVFTDFPDDKSMYTNILIVDAALYYPEEFSVAYVNESVNVNMPSRTTAEIFTIKLNSQEKFKIYYYELCLIFKIQNF